MKNRVTARPTHQRYVAFLRGISPLNAKMPELKRAFERAKLEDVKTVLGTGNVVFSTSAASDLVLARRVEAALQQHLGRSFFTLVRSLTSLRRLLASDAYSPFELEPDSKRVITFLSKKPAAGLRLPIQVDTARILRVSGLQVLSAYVPSPMGGPVLMALLEKTFGKDITTRTWETVAKTLKPSAASRSRGP